MKFPIITFLKKKRVAFKMIRKATANFHKFDSDRDLSREQVKEIRAYFKDRLGVRVPIIWHRYYYRRTGKYSPEYIPSSLYRIELLGRFNQMQTECAYRDKNLTGLIIKGISQPETIAKNMNGYYYINDSAVSKEKVLHECSNLDDVIIKPSLFFYGIGVRRFSVHNGITSDGESIGHILDNYKKDFIIQRAVHQHDALNTLNPTSVNTIRILTYRSGMDVLILYTVLRIGRIGRVTDNETAGGMSVRINSDGTLAKYAYSKPGEDMIERTDTGVILEGYRIPSFENAIKAVKSAHLELPYYDLIGWDIAIDTAGEPVLIEWNTEPDLSQSANEGPAFGEYTDRVLKEIWSRPNTMY